MSIANKIVNKIAKIRSQSEEEKKQSAIRWTIFLMFLIFIVWSLTFSLSAINRQATELRLREEAEILATTPTPNISRPSRLRSLGADNVNHIIDGFQVVKSYFGKK